MAYRRSSRSWNTRGRTTRTRTGYTGRRQSARRSTTKRRVSSRPQTVRIELVGMPANPVSRSLPFALQPKAPTKAKY